MLWHIQKTQFILNKVCLLVFDFSQCNHHFLAVKFRQNRVHSSFAFSFRLLWHYLLIIVWYVSSVIINDLQDCFNYINQLATISMWLYRTSIVMSVGIRLINTVFIMKLLSISLSTSYLLSARFFCDISVQRRIFVKCKGTRVCHYRFTCDGRATTSSESRSCVLLFVNSPVLPMLQWMECICREYFCC